MPRQNLVRIGTRGSPLALYQARFVADLIKKYSNSEYEAEIVTFTTKGDQLTTERLINSGGKGLFTREIDAAISYGDVDLGVHSLKDVPSLMPEGQELISYLPREDPRDALLSNASIHRIEDLPHGATVGTASLRREAQLLALRPDLNIIPFRGKVETRMEKLRRGDADATLLAMAGLKRLKLDPHATAIPMREMLPAAGQGIIAVAVDRDRVDTGLAALLQQIDDTKTRAMATAERALLAELDGSCRTAIAAQLFDLSGTWMLRAEVLAPDGQQKWTAQATALLSTDSEALAGLGRELAEQIRLAAGGDFPTFDT